MTRDEMKILRKLEKLLKKKYVIDSEIARLQFKLGELTTRREATWKSIL